MKALVTGGAGFVGANLVRALLGDGVDVRVLVRQGSDVRNLVGLNVELCNGDVRRFEQVYEAIKGCSHVFHVAACYSTEEADRRVMYEINVDGTRNVMKAAQLLGVSRVVHTSTVGTIGRRDDARLPNEGCKFNIWGTATHYAKSKYLGERVALSAAAAGLPVVVVNPCAPVGPFDAKPSVTGQRILDFLMGKAPSFLSGGINFVDVGDVARGHILAARKGRVGERYILGGKNLSYAQFLKIMRRASGLGGRRPGARGLAKSILGSVLWRPRDTGLNRQSALVCDCSRAIFELGLPQTPLEVAFSRAVRWYRENGYVDGTRSTAGGRSI